MSRITSFVFRYDLELVKMRAWIQGLASQAGPKLRVLDVGCGNGRHLHWLAKQGYDAVGVDVSLRVVSENTQAGYLCMTPDQLKQSARQFDLIVMSHIIEHFSPDALFAFLTDYLSMLKPGGQLLIATPLNTNYFYDDFDHVKPYHPVGLLMVFAGKNSETGQIQFQSGTRLELEKLWYKRSYFMLRHLAGRRVRCASTPWIKLMDIVAATLWRFTGGWFGQTVGWVGLYRKT